MATQSAIHHMLAILAGDEVPARDDLARLIGRLGWSGLAPDTLDAGDVQFSSRREVTPWFVRLTFPGIAPPDAFIVDVAIAAGPQGSSRWLLVGPQSRSAVSSVVARLRAIHRIHAVPFKKIEGR